MIMQIKIQKFDSQDHTAYFKLIRNNYPYFIARVYFI